MPVFNIDQAPEIALMFSPPLLDENSCRLSRLLNASWGRWQLIVILAMLLPATPLTAQSDDAAQVELAETSRFVSGLRARQLYRLAEQHCREALAEQDLAATARVELTIELMKTLVDAGLQASGPQRLAKFEEAQRVAADFQSDFPNAPREILIRVQAALMQLTAGRLLRWEYELGGRELTTAQRANEQLRTAEQQLEALDEELEQLIPQRYRARLDEGQLSGDQLLGLRQRIRLQRVEAVQQRALLYPADDRNRTSLLTEVLERLEELAASVPQDNPLWWEVQLTKSTTLLELERVNDASNVLAALPDESPDASTRTARLIATARVALAQDKPQAALRQLWEYRQQQATRDPELDQVALAAMLRIAQLDELTPEQQRRWQTQAVALAREIGQTHGTFWGRRADLQLVGSAGTAGQLQSAAMLLQVGDEHYLQQRLEDARKAYQQAARTARQDQQTAAWFTAARKAGLVAQQLQLHAAARDELRQLALAQPQNSEAAPTHLQAIWNQAQLARDSNEQLPRYRELLEEHLQQWGSGPTAVQARQWLGKLLRFQNEPATAFAVLLGVSQAAEEAASLIDTAAAAADEAVQAADPGERASVANRCATLLRDWAAADDSVSQAEDARSAWSPAATNAAVAAARLWLLYCDDRQTLAQQWLEQALQAGTPQDGAWREQALSLLVIALAQRPSGNDEVKAIVGELQDRDPARLWEVAEVLGRFIAEAEDAAQGERLAKVSLQLLDVLEQGPARGDRARQTQLQQLRAAALQASGRPAAAAELYRQLWEADPKRGEWLQRWAETLSAQETPAALEEALRRWRQLAQGSRPQTPRWFRAKYEVARTLVRLDRVEEAAKLLRYLKATPPGWEDSTLRDQFEALLKISSQ